MKKREILVLGAGVSGLSTGILLLKQGFEVTIWAKDLPPNITSSKAGASWFPYLCDPKDKVIKWGKASLAYLEKELVGKPNTGCIKRREIELYTSKQPDPWWEEAVSFKRAAKEDLPPGYIDGFEIEGVLMDSSIYVGYLINELKSLGGEIIQKNVESINAAFEDYDIVVNCTGLGSRDLFGDKSVYPVRGQMIRVKSNGFNKVVADNAGPNALAVIIPRINDIVLGGTTQANNWNLEVDGKDREDILRKVGNLYPVFKNVEIIGETVGLRPARPEVRLEAENFSGKTVVHNYGHGGAGFTLSWGCAQEVVSIVEKI
ncbi:MAG TPA: FAD-dependent oxidoreductase [Candidatus Saccharimonadales bacterium]|nr:FAD-dependent oxidoreductase [Candidatus Saccharimonadales bacterium]